MCMCMCMCMCVCVWDKGLCSQLLSLGVLVNGMADKSEEEILLKAKYESTMYDV